MIDLGGPSTAWSGITVLSDYSDKTQFYFLPPAPRLAIDRESGRKVFKLIKLAGGLADPASTALTGGVAFFDCNLALTEDEQEQLEEHVRQTFHVPAGEIKLSPLLYRSGEVTCYVLGEQDWQDDAPPERKNLFVERLQGFGKPSLYGANQATFSARLSREGASLFAQSIAGGGPIGISVVYSLKFDALSLAFKFKVEANWEQIYHYLEEKIGLDVWFVRFESSNIIEELEQAQLLRIEEVIADPAASGDVQQLRKQLQEFVLDKFFTPVLSAGEPKTNRIPGMVADVLRATVLVPTFGYQRRELTQTERKTLSFDITRVTAVERTIYPQANLFALIPPEELQHCIQEVNTDQDMFFRQLDVRCVVGGFDFRKSAIAWVHPFIRYGSSPEEHADTTLASAADELTFKTWLQESEGYRYHTHYDVEFVAPDPTDPERIYGKDLRLTRAEEVRTDRLLAINPLELFETRELEFATRQDLAWDRFPLVVVEVAHEDSAQYSVQASYALDSQHRSARFRVRVPVGVQAVTRYRIVYRRAPGDGRPIAEDWQIAHESLALIEDPFPQRFSVRVHIAELASDLGWADVSLRYANPERPGIFQEGRLFFDNVTPQVWTVNATDPTRRQYQFRYTLFFKDNTSVESPTWIDADTPTLTLGRKVPMQRTVRIETQGESFESVLLRDVSVTLWSAEEPPDSVGKLIVFDSTEQVEEWTYRATSAQQLGYRYEAFYRWMSGRTRTLAGSSREGALSLKLPTTRD